MADAPDRVSGVLLYAGAVVVLAVGAAWWIRAAPPLDGTGARVSAWRRTVEEVVPERVDQVEARTYVLNPGDDLDAEVEVRPGQHQLTLVCAGRGQVRVRFTSAGMDSGRAVPCAEEPGLLMIPAALGERLFLDIVAESQGQAVFRWQLLRPS